MGGFEGFGVWVVQGLEAYRASADSRMVFSSAACQHAFDGRWERVSDLVIAETNLDFHVSHGQKC